jgi:putative hydrolase of HD superfamily
VVQRIGPPIEAGCPALWAWMRARLDEELARGWFGTLPALGRSHGAQVR